MPGSGAYAQLVRGREMFLDHVTIGLEPIAIFDEFTALHGPDLHPATALVILGRNLHGWHHPAKREALDRLHALFDIFAAGLGAALGFDGVACRLGMQRSDD